VTCGKLAAIIIDRQFSVAHVWRGADASLPNPMDPPLHSNELGQVLAHYPPDCRPSNVEPLGSAGGYSGARLWRLAAPRGPLCLRRWPPEHPTPERLQYIHAVLRHVGRSGIALLPIPVTTVTGETFVGHAGHLWELTVWMPGRADYRDDPRPERLWAALAALATVHRAAESFPGGERQPRPSPGIAQRLEQVRMLQGGGRASIAAAMGRTAVAALDEHARRLLERFDRAAPAVERTLLDTAMLAVPIQPCLRDVWHDHLLFEGDRVSGIVDFGALRPENVAGDVARLLGSLAGDESSAWQTGLTAYEATRPLSPAERRLVAAFDGSTTLLSGMNWLTWIYLERRRFDDLAAVGVRLDAILMRLEALSAGPTPWAEPLDEWLRG
jgi:homoserine kinase type II